MKRITIIIFLLSLNFSFSQKKELRKAQKLFDGGDIAAASQLLTEFQSIMENADQKVKPQYQFLKGKIAQQNKEFKIAYDLFNNIKQNSSLKEEVTQQMLLLSADIVNSAIDDNNAGNFKASTEKLYMAYNIDPEANQDYLYFAASSAVNADMFEVALSYYIKLKEIKYTGVVTKYFVTEVDSGNEIEVTQSEYDLYKKSKSYEGFREEETPSRFPEIVKNIALIYSELGDNDKAMSAVQEARKEKPDDLNLILTEANIYIQLGEKERFKELMSQAIAQDPNNANLLYNLAVVTSDLGDKAAARGYYEKAIEIDPNYRNAYLNLVALILEGEQGIVEQMNSLGTSAADNARYDSLKSSREDLYRECVPILKSLIKIGDAEEDAIKTLMNIYGTLGDTEGFKEMKALLGD
ncbi:MAG: tetratricopeptide repeat protein [Flavobacteriaceae bacterium]|tara:strand:+ start:1115 stop:2341 length:1227 start_codon:yes stop_codon:yes gene_type:complete